MFREYCFFVVAFSFLLVWQRRRDGGGGGGGENGKSEIFWHYATVIPARYSAETRECWDCKSCACSVKPGDGSGSLKLSNRGNAKVTGLKFGSFMNYNLCLGRL